jgi:hypothetical protein
MKNAETFQATTPTERGDRSDTSSIKGEIIMARNNQTTITAEPGKQEIFITREFDAPRELVFKAFTDPKLYIQWLGPRELAMTLEKFEPNNGGSYRYIRCC